MGISRYDASVLIAESLRIPFKGSVLQLGRQGISFDFRALQKIAKLYKYELKEPEKLSFGLKEHFSSRNFIDDKCFFSSLGFNKVLSLDFSNYESADIIFDLNGSDTPSDLLNSFDVIVDGGTIEHVFHLPNVMKNIANMLKIGGRIIHMSPSSNHVDHGFYMFSPTFFMDYYSANKFEINMINFVRCSKMTQTEPWECFNYTPNSLDSYSFGGLDGAMYMVLCIATKTSESTNNVIPQQGACLTAWNIHKNYQNLETKKILNNKNHESNWVRVIKYHTPKQIHPVLSLIYSIPHKMVSKISGNYNYYVKDYCYGKKPNLKLNDEIKWG